MINLNYSLGINEIFLFARLMGDYFVPKTRYVAADHVV